MKPRRRVPLRRGELVVDGVGDLSPLVGTDLGERHAVALPEQMLGVEVLGVVHHLHQAAHDASHPTTVPSTGTICATRSWVSRSASEVDTARTTAAARADVSRHASRRATTLAMPLSSRYAAARRLSSASPRETTPSANRRSSGSETSYLWKAATRATARWLTEPAQTADRPPHLGSLRDSAEHVDDSPDSPTDDEFPPARVAWRKPVGLPLLDRFPPRAMSRFRHQRPASSSSGSAGTRPAPLRWYPPSVRDTADSRTGLGDDLGTNTGQRHARPMAPPVRRYPC